MGNGYGDEEWEGTTRKALLQQLEREEDEGVEVGTGVDADPSEVASLKEHLERVTATWRKRTQGQRLSAQRWIQQEDCPKAQWRLDLAELLESTWTHVFIVTLLVVDLAATAIDILKTIHNKSQVEFTTFSYNFVSSLSDQEVS